MKPFTTIAVVIFALVAVVHLVRLFTGREVIVNGVAIPVWASFVALIVAGGLAVMLWREARAAILDWIALLGPSQHEGDP